MLAFHNEVERGLSPVAALTLLDFDVGCWYSAQVAFGGYDSFWFHFQYSQECMVWSSSVPFSFFDFGPLLIAFCFGLLSYLLPEVVPEYDCRRVSCCSFDCFFGQLVCFFVSDDILVSWDSVDFDLYSPFQNSVDVVFNFKAPGLSRFVVLYSYSPDCVFAVR